MISGKTVAIASTVICIILMGYRYFTKNRNSKTYTYNNEYFDGRSINICTICLEEFRSFSSESLKLPCSHRFHKECIITVFRHEASGRRTCPLCRQEVPEAFISQIF